jgi:hypothetical protein
MAELLIDLVQNPRGYVESRLETWFVLSNVLLPIGAVQFRVCFLPFKELGDYTSRRWLDRIFLRNRLHIFGLIFKQSRMRVLFAVLSLLGQFLTFLVDAGLERWLLCDS